MTDPAFATEILCRALTSSGVTETSKEDASRSIRHSLDDTGAAASPGFVWVDILHPTEVEANFLRDDLGMHPLAVEDCLRGRQRPKLDGYSGYSFLVFYAVRINPKRARMALNEIHVFLGDGFLITVHDQLVEEIPTTLVAWEAHPSRWSTPAALAHAILDQVVDNYFPVVEHFSQRIEGFEEEVFGGESTMSMERVAHARREILHFRRILGPERDVFSLLVRRELPRTNPDLVPYYLDVHDHILRVAEEVDTMRELIAGLVEIHSTHTGRQLNQTMQTLTSWSIILMSVTLIAGIYGMNFEFMPELGLRWGYIGALGFMLGIGAVLLHYFRKNHWL